MKKVVKKSKKVISKKVISHDPHTEEIKRYIGAVSENFQHGLSAIGEQFSGLNKKLDEHGTKLDEHGKILGEHSKILNSHTEILSSHTEMIGRLMVDVEEIKVNMREKIGREEFNKLETRLVSLESFVFSKRAKIGPKSK